MKAAALLALPLATYATASGESAGIPRVALHQLCVTEGALGTGATGRFTIDAPKVRATLRSGTGDAATLRFTYLGPTVQQSALGSGEQREQIGLKLRAQDSCNVIYAMWRIQPEARLVVQVKRNVGLRTSAACGNSGYSTVKPEHALAAPVIAPGGSHELAAQIAGDLLTVSADGTPVWSAHLGPDAAVLRGPAGFRTDNGRFELELQSATAGPAAECAAGRER